MNLILRRDPVWLRALPSPNASTILLLGSDGQQVAVPATLLLAVSPLVRSILIGLLPPAYSPCIISLPVVTEDVLHVIVDILATGATGCEHMDKIEDVRHAFEMLGVEVSLVSYHLESLDVDQALDRSIKVEDYIEGPDEENITREVIVKSENKNSADVEVEVVKSKRMRGNQHLKTVTSIKSIHERDKFTCTLCPQRFKQKNHLVRHIKTIHEQIKFPCKICPQKFTQKQHLVIHIKAVHDQIKIPCNQCSKQFARKRDLVRHIQVVHDQIKIPCNHCSRKFGRKKALVIHIKSVHANI